MGESVFTSDDLELVLSAAGPADHGEIFSLWAEVSAEPGVFPRRPPVTESEFRGAWLQGMTAVMAARLSGRLAGSYFLRPAYPGLAGHIANAGYIVAPDLRGRGVGTALAEHSFAEARRNGFDAMLYQLVIESNPSRRLWERLGFENVGRIPEAVEGQEAYLYWRSLTDGAT